MKKTFFALLLVLLTSPLITAADIEIKESYDGKETLIAKISGNFLKPLTENDFALYRMQQRERDNSTVPVKVITEPEVKKMDGDHYMQMQLSENIRPGNYSLELKNVRYRKAGRWTDTTTHPVRKNFTISDAQARFRIEQGFVETDADFSITAENLLDGRITIKKEIVGTDQGTEEITTRNIKENISFDHDLFYSGFNEIMLSSGNTSYRIPVFVTSESAKRREESGRDDGARDGTERGQTTIVLGTFRTKITLQAGSDQTDSETLYVHNKGNKHARNVVLKVSDEIGPYVKLSQSEVATIRASTIFKISMNVSAGGKAEKINGRITARYENLVSEIPLELNFVGDPEDVTSNGPGGSNSSGDANESGESEDEGDSDYAFRTCRELNGIVCEEGQSCTGDEVATPQAKCCLEGDCEDDEKDEENPLLRRIIGIGILVAVAGFLAWFFLMKFKRTKRAKVDLKKIAELGEGYEEEL